MTLRSRHAARGELDTGRGIFLKKMVVAAAESSEATQVGHVAVSDIRRRLLKASRAANVSVFRT